jgi:hypothetical protein
LLGSTFGVTEDAGLSRRGEERSEEARRDRWGAKGSDERRKNDGKGTRIDELQHCEEGNE